jgi:hypothetical protein
LQDSEYIASASDAIQRDKIGGASDDNWITLMLNFHKLEIAGVCKKLSENSKLYESLVKLKEKGVELHDLISIYRNSNVRLEGHIIKLANNDRMVEKFKFVCKQFKDHGFSVQKNLGNSGNNATQLISLLYVCLKDTGSSEFELPKQEINNNESINPFKIGDEHRDEGCFVVLDGRLNSINGTIIKEIPSVEILNKF